MMRKIQKKRKSSTEKEAADESASDDGNVDPHEEEKTDSDTPEVDSKQSELWDHFARVSEGTAQCALCGQRLNASLSTLRRHLKNQHPDTKLDTSTESIGTDRNVDSDCPPEKSDPGGKGGLPMGRRRAGVWHHFVRLNKTTAQCKGCKKDLNYSASISNLKRHLRVKHPARHASLPPPKATKGVKIEDVKEYVDEDEVEQSDSEYQPETDEDSEGPDLRGGKVARGGPRKHVSFVWRHFRKLDEEVAQCSHCRHRMNFRNNQSNLKRHLQNKHPKEMGTASGDYAAGNEDDNEEDSDACLLDDGGEEDCSGLFKRRKSEMWRHFVTLSRETARCRHCQKVLNYRSSTTNLKRHLRVKHPKVHARLGQQQSGKVARKEGDTSFASLRSKMNRSGPKASTEGADSPVRQAKRAGNKESLIRNKLVSDAHEASDEDSSVDAGMPDAFHGDSGGDSSVENEMPTAIREAIEGGSPDKNRFDVLLGNREDLAKDSSVITVNRHNASGGDESSSVKSDKKSASAPRPAKVPKPPSKRKRSHLWDYFTVIDEKFAECNTCKHKLVHKSGLSNLAKHYTMKHSLAEIADAAASTGMSEIEIAVNALNCDEHQSAPEVTTVQSTGGGGDQPKAKKKRKAESHWRCAIWRLFDKIDETFSQCKSCLKRISHRSTNANLLKHTRIKHPDVYGKFEERLRDFSHNVNVLVDHFFPDSLITSSTSGNSIPQIVSSQEAAHLSQQEYQIVGENHQPQMYDNMQPYSFPVIFVQEEEVVTTSTNAPPTSVITTAPPTTHSAGGNNNNSHTPYSSVSGHLATPPGGNSTQDPSSSISMESGNGPAHLPHGMTEGPGRNPPAQDPNTSVGMGGNNGAHLALGEGGPTQSTSVVHLPHGMGESAAMQGPHRTNPAQYHGHQQQPHLTYAHHHAGGAQLPFGGNYSQVVATSFSVGGGQQDRLVGMVEESNQLLRGMQTAIERQSDVLLRLAESIGRGMRAS